jgi:hypothetical protein
VAGTSRDPAPIVNDRRNGIAGDSKSRDGDTILPP